MAKGQESSIVKAILEYLTYKGYLCKRNQSGMTFIKNGSKTRAIKMGEAGWPDIIGLLNTGRFFGIEVKSGKNKPTEIQSEILEKIKKNQGIAIVAYSLDDIIRAGF